MKLHNTLSKSVEDFNPQNAPVVTVYSCGPTVYDNVHIGNLGSFIFADTLRRTLKESGYEPKHVMNFTDIDDKTIRRSRELYPELEPHEALSKLTAGCVNTFLDDMALVGNDIGALVFVNATDPSTMENIRALIQSLHSKGFAYLADDGVYFSISAYVKSGRKYGQLSNVTVNNEAVSRIQNDEYDKDAAQDFALWKKQKDNEPSWPLEINGTKLDGRPGWHIECSAMSVTALGQPFDIHTGGVDLIFPHHENEIAQSTAGADDDKYAKFFVHNEHMLVDGKKMSKSLGNFFTLREIIDKGCDPLAFRMLVLQAHYRSQAHFTWENLEAAQNRLQNFRQLSALHYQPIAHSNVEGQDKGIREYSEQIIAAMQDDLNSPEALKLVNLVFEKCADGITSDDVEPFKNFRGTVDRLLGLNLAEQSDIDAKAKALIRDREAAREAKDWSKADELRGQLLASGVGVRDTPHGTIWFRT